MLMERCAAVVTAYVAEEKQSGTRPLPRARRAELLLVLRETRRLQLVAGSLEAQISGTVPRTTGLRDHLLLLYPSLCECVACQDPAVTQELIALFHTVGTEMGIGYS